MMICGLTLRWMLRHPPSCQKNISHVPIWNLRTLSVAICAKPCPRGNFPNPSKMTTGSSDAARRLSRACSVGLNGRTVHKCDRKPENSSLHFCDRRTALIYRQSFPWELPGIHRLFGLPGSRNTNTSNLEKFLHTSAYCNQREDKPDAKKTPLMKENVLTIPNLLTMSRFVMTPMLCYLIVAQSYSWACGMFIVTGITDVLDGWIARHFPSQASAFGSFLDPLADKFLVISVFLTLTWVNLIPLPLAALIIARDVGLIAAAHYVRYISLTPPFTFLEFYDVTNPSAQLQPTNISKANTVIQLSLVAFTLAAPVLGFVDHPALQALWYLTAGTTVASGIGYMFTKGTFKLNRPMQKKP